MLSLWDLNPQFLEVVSLASCSSQPDIDPVVSPLPQSYLPPTKNGVEPKRPSRPINITSLVRLSTTVPNTIVVSWTAEIGRVRNLIVVSWTSEIGRVRNLTLDTNPESSNQDI